MNKQQLEKQPILTQKDLVDQCVERAEKILDLAMNEKQYGAAIEATRVCLEVGATKLRFEETEAKFNEEKEKMKGEVTKE